MIPLYLCSSSTDDVVTFDDPSVDTDRGAAFTARLKSAVFTGLRAGGWSRLRRFVQTVTLGTSATFRVTPVVDGSESVADAQTESLLASSGAVQPLAVPLASAGSRFQVVLEVTAHVGRTQLGEWAREWVDRRRHRQ